MDTHASWPRRPAPFHRLPSRFQAPRQAPHFAAHSPPRPRNCSRGRPSLRLRRQHLLRSRQHLLPLMQRPPHPPLLARCPHQSPQGRELPPLPHPHPRRLVPLTRRVPDAWVCLFSWFCSSGGLPFASSAKGGSLRLILGAPGTGFVPGSWVFSGFSCGTVTLDCALGFALVAPAF